MAEVWATKTGQWSDTTVWNTGSLPTSVDDVFANTFTVTISNINPQVLSVRTTARTGGTAGGGFTITNGVSLTANVLAGSTSCITFSQGSPNTCTIFGNLTGSLTTASRFAFDNTSSGIVNIFGDVRAGSTGNSYGVNNPSTGIVNIVGIVRGGFGTSGDNPQGILNNSTGTINITGGVIGGTGTTSAQHGILNTSAGGTINVNGFVQGGTTGAYVGISNSSTGTVNITGTVLGGLANGAHGCLNSVGGTITVVGSVSGGFANGVDGIRNTTVGNIFIYGNVIGGNTGSGNVAVGVNNAGAGSVFVYGSVIGGVNLGTCAGAINTTGFLYATKAIGNGFGLGSIGLGGQVGLTNGQNGRAYVEQVEFGPRGQTPISGPVYILPSNRNTLTGVLTALGNTVTFYNSLSVSGLMPPASSVRLGTVYNVGNSVGTMAVPSASAVQVGVPVDNTVGVAALTPQNVWGYARLSATDVGSMGVRLRNAATTQSVGSQIASFNL